MRDPAKEVDSQFLQRIALSWEDPYKHFICEHIYSHLQITLIRTAACDSAKEVDGQFVQRTALRWRDFSGVLEDATAVLFGLSSSSSSAAPAAAAAACTQHLLPAALPPNSASAPTATAGRTGGVKRGRSNSSSSSGHAGLSAQHLCATPPLPRVLSCFYPERLKPFFLEQLRDRICAKSLNPDQLRDRSCARSLNSNRDVPGNDGSEGQAEEEELVLPGVPSVADYCCVLRAVAAVWPAIADAKELVR